jgi:hypothetical protein
MHREYDRVFVEVLFNFPKRIPLVFAVLTNKKYRSLSTEENPDLRKLCKKSSIEDLDTTLFSCITESERAAKHLMSPENVHLFNASRDVLEILHISDQKYYGPNRYIAINLNKYINFAYAANS